LISVLAFMSRDFELGRKLRRDLRKIIFLSDLRLARRESQSHTELILCSIFNFRYHDNKGLSGIILNDTI